MKRLTSLQLLSLLLCVAIYLGYSFCAYGQGTAADYERAKVSANQSQSSR